MQATQQGMILGTAAYMSPEQAKGLPADKRADVFAFGCILFEMLTGRQTFSGELATEILAHVISQEPDYTTLDTNLHPDTKKLLRRCLDKNPMNRFRDVGDVRFEIEQVLADPSGVIVEPSAAVVEVEAAPQSKLPWVVTVVLGVVISGVAVWILKPDPPTDPLPVSRSDYDLPDGINFRNTGRNVLAVSLNGRSFVYNATGGLYLRSLNEFDARLIPGTEDTLTNPFFSPDSEWVGFWNGSENRIEKIAVSGGTPIQIGPTQSNPFGLAGARTTGFSLSSPMGSIAFRPMAVHPN